MSKKDYQNWSHDRLLHEYKELLNRKKFGLVWEDEKEDIAEKCKDFLPVLKEEKKKEVSTNKDDVNHIFIEGDNYHALSALNYTHKKKIDLIFIDPPYNTGNKSWIYNNSYVEKDDRFRHSRWLSFMSKRLKLAKNLLKDDGVIVVTIDDYELYTLGLLMDSIFFEQNRIGVLVVESNPRGRTSNAFFATSHEYYLFYAKNASKAKIENLPLTPEQELVFKFEDEISKYRLLPLRKSGAASRINDRPKQFFTIYVNDKTLELTLEKKKGLKKLLPIDNKGDKRVWKLGVDNCGKLIKTGDVIAQKSKNGTISLFQKDRIKAGRKPKTVWVDPKYDASSHGSILVSEMLNRGNAFDYPKSLYAVLDSLSVLVNSKKEAVILDFFAGSGTTGHAVLELNKRDNGKRQFILCTDDQDNNGRGMTIAKDICYPRIKKAIEGFNFKNKSIEGLGGNLKYFETSFVANVKTDNDKRIFTNQSTEMLCLAENTFDKVLNKKGQFAFYQNNEQMTGIIYDEDCINDFRKEIEKYKKSIVVYVFSYDHTYNEEDFEDIKNIVKVKPIPEVILNVYRKIYKDLYKTKRI